MKHPRCSSPRSSGPTLPRHCRVAPNLTNAELRAQHATKHVGAERLSQQADRGTISAPICRGASCHVREHEQHADADGDHSDAEQ